MRPAFKIFAAGLVVAAAIPAWAAATALGPGAATAPVPATEMSLTTKMMFLVLQVGVILFAAKLGGLVASLLKMPSILGELAAGCLIGPYALGGLGFGSGFFEHRSEERRVG